MNATARLSSSLAADARAPSGPLGCRPSEEPVEGQQDQQRQCHSDGRDEDGSGDQNRLVVAVFLRAHGTTVWHDLGDECSLRNHVDTRASAVTTERIAAGANAGDGSA